MKKTMKRMLCLSLALVLVLSVLPLTQAADLRPGDKGSKVKSMQQNLIGLGLLSGAADGSYGNQTKAAVKSFQSQFGLSASGTANEQTQTAIRNAMVRVQTELQIAGYNPGAADGYYGNNTSSALKKYQKAKGLKQTGIANKETRTVMDDNTQGLRVNQMLGSGSNKTQIKYLQQDLIGLGYLTGAADGSYGSMTKQAVKDYQKAYGLSVDGSAGCNTLTSIKNTVVALQSDLDRKGYSNGTNNGVYGSSTTSAVKSYQKAVGLQATGIAGSTTMRKLYGVSFHSGSEGTDSAEVRRSVKALYQDGDYRKIYYGWKGQYSTTVHTSGCGGVVMAMALNSLLDTNQYDGQNVMQWFADHEAYYGDGTYQSGMVKYAQKLGLHGFYCDTANDAIKNLKKERLVIALVADKSGDALFCSAGSTGHYVLLSGYRQKNGEDQVYVNNSLSYKKSGWFDMEDLMDNVKTERDGYNNSFVVLYK